MKGWIACATSVAAWSLSPLVVGVGLLGTSAWLLSTHWLKPGRSEFPGLLGAMLIGIAQGLAVLPGLSRSAGTIACALWLGVRPDRAFELSFLCSLPALLAIVVLDGRALVHEPGTLIVTLVAALIAFVASLLALTLLERVVRAGRLAWFAGWTFPLAVATLAMALVWPHAGHAADPAGQRAVGPSTTWAQTGESATVTSSDERSDLRGTAPRLGQNPGR